MTTPALSAIAAAGPVPSSPVAPAPQADVAPGSFQTVLVQQRQQHAEPSGKQSGQASSAHAETSEPSSKDVSALPTEHDAIQLATLQWRYLADINDQGAPGAELPGTHAARPHDADTPAPESELLDNETGHISQRRAGQPDEHAEALASGLAAGMTAASLTPQTSATERIAPQGGAPIASAARTTRIVAGRDAGVRLPTDRAASDLSTADASRPTFERALNGVHTDTSGQFNQSAQGHTSATGLPAVMLQAATPLHAAATGAASSLQGQALVGTGVHAIPLQHPQWGQTLGHQMLNLTQTGVQGVHTAELRLDPPDLGPLRITISLHDQVAHAVFASPHLQVRQTVEAALPQLQQLFEQAGLSLGQTSVNDQQANDGKQSQDNQGRGLPAGSSGNDGSTDLAARPARAATGLIDTFA